MKLEFETNPASLPLVDHTDVDQMISDSDSPEVTKMLRDGIEAAQKGDRAEARTLLLRVTEADAGNENAWLWLASISEYPEELLVFLKNVLSINPQNERAVEWTKATESLMAKTFVQRGIDATKNDQKEMAKQCFLQAIVHDNHSELAWLWLASVSDSPEEKMSHLQKVIRINPHNENAIASLKSAKNQMAKILLPKANKAAIAGNRVEAQKLLDEIVNDAPDFEDAWMLKAHLADSLEDKIGYFEQVLEVNPDNQVAKANLESLKMFVGDNSDDTSSDDDLEVTQEDKVEVEQQKTEESDVEAELQEAEVEMEELNKNDSIEEENEVEMQDSVDENELLEMEEQPQAELSEAEAIQEAEIEAKAEMVVAETVVDEEASVEKVENEMPVSEETITAEDMSAEVEKQNESAELEASDIAPSELEESENADVEMQEAEVEEAEVEEASVEQQESESDEIYQDSKEEEIIYADNSVQHYSELVEEEQVNEEPIEEFNEEPVQEFEEVVEEQAPMAMEEADVSYYSVEKEVEEDRQAVFNPEENGYQQMTEATEEYHSEIEANQVKDEPENMNLASSAVEESEQHYEMDAGEEFNQFENTENVEAVEQESYNEVAKEDNNFTEQKVENEAQLNQEPEIEQNLEASESEEGLTPEKPSEEIKVEMVPCGFCLVENEPQAFACKSCQTILSLSDIEMLISQEQADSELVQRIVDKLEADKESIGVSIEDLKLMGIGHLNLKNYRKGFEYLKEVSQKNEDDLMLRSQIDILALRVAEIEKQEEEFEARPKSKTILVVDDSPTVRKLISGKLEKCGHNAVCAVDGMDALAKINEIIPDLILLDITMPRMDGYQVCKLIRGNESTRDVPVVMISGKDGFFDKVRGRMAGTDNYITKPFGPETLMKTVNEYIS